jgi:uncharacterized protein YqiB (DUF1249 family)
MTTCRTCGLPLPSLCNRLYHPAGQCKPGVRRAYHRTKARQIAYRLAVRQAKQKMAA